MEALDKTLTWVNKLLRLIGGIAIVAMMLITCLDVTFRAFDHPIIWAVDLVALLALLALACPLPMTHMEGGHVGVDLLVMKLKPRTQECIDAITTLVSSVLFAIVAWQMWLYAAELASKGEVSMTVQIPMSPFIYLVSVCLAVLSLVIFVECVRHAGKVVKG
jgi:TRAP-type C4-dicarboxylate transport system permease small subunit